MEFGEDSTTTRTLESGLNLKRTAMACIRGKMEIDTKANGTCALSMEQGLIFLLMETLIQENI